MPLRKFGCFEKNIRSAFSFPTTTSKVASNCVFLQHLAICRKVFSAMAHIVTQPCVGCRYTDCVVVCPVECFYEGEKMLYIHPEECIDCEACVAECPVEAIFHEDNVPEEWKNYIEMNAEMASKTKVITEKKKPLAES